MGTSQEDRSVGSKDDQTSHHRRHKRSKHSTSSRHDSSHHKSSHGHKHRHHRHHKGDGKKRQSHKKHHKHGRLRKMEVTLDERLLQTTLDSLEVEAIEAVKDEVCGWGGFQLLPIPKIQNSRIQKSHSWELEHSPP